MKFSRKILLSTPLGTALRWTCRKALTRRQKVFRRACGKRKIETKQVCVSLQFLDQLPPCTAAWAIRQKPLCTHIIEISEAPMANITTWRNEFVHLGLDEWMVTFNEVVTAFEDGKELIHCLAAFCSGEAKGTR